MTQSDQTSASVRVYDEVVSALEAYHGGKSWYREAQELQMKLADLEVNAFFSC